MMPDVFLSVNEIGVSVYQNSWQMQAIMRMDNEMRIDS